MQGGKPKRERIQDSVPSHSPGKGKGSLSTPRGRSQPSGRAVLTPWQELSRKVTLHKRQSKEQCVLNSSSWEPVPSRGIHRVLQTTEIISGANNPHVVPAPAVDPHTGEIWSTSCTHCSLVPGAGWTNYSLPAPPAHTCTGNPELQQPSCTSSTHL